MKPVTHSLEILDTPVDLSVIRPAYQGIADIPQWTAYQDMLAQLHEAKTWLACDCINNPVDPPLLHVRRTPKQHYTLVRMSRRAEHAEDCLFRWDESEHALLLDIISLAKLHIFFPGNLVTPVKDKYARLRECFVDATGIDRDPYTHPGALYRWAKEEGRGYRHFLSAVNAYDKDKVSVRIKDYNYTIKVAGHIADLLSKDSPSTGPLLLLAEVKAQDGLPVIRKGWVVPIVDMGSLVPVQSEHRTTWTMLLREFRTHSKGIPGVLSIESLLPGNVFYDLADILLHLQNNQSFTIQVKGEEDPKIDTDLYHAYEAKGDGADNAFIKAIYGISKKGLSN